MQPRGGNGNGDWPSEACRQFDAQLEGYFEGEHRLAITAHAAACEYCGVVLADLLALQDAAGSLGSVEPPSGLWASLKARLIDEGIIRRSREACQRFDAELQSYLEGEDRPELRAHASECEYCGAVLADLLLLRTAAAELEPEDPPARMWANVRAHLVQEGLIRSRRNPPQSWFRWLWRPIPVAALATLLLLVLVFVRSWTTSPNPPSEQAASVPVDRGVETAVAEMEHAFRAQSATLDPRMKVAYDKSLATLDGEIRDCQASLARQPDDSLTREYLTSAYNEKAEVLASALELGDTNVR
ncbi:MAG TPA: hypothetical protein VMT20_25990 [Terriglobia bacterium]|nr:hypothetical protein [Terriglobia bacterium]